MLIGGTVPRVGPTIKPIEKAMPINAIPLPRFAGSRRSAIVAVLKPILPLERPPIVREMRNIKNESDDKHHSR